MIQAYDYVTLRCDCANSEEESVRQNCKHIVPRQVIRQFFNGRYLVETLDEHLMTYDPEDLKPIPWIQLTAPWMQLTGPWIQLTAIK
jgi:hypothetical protein